MPHVFVSFIHEEERVAKAAQALLRARLDTEHLVRSVFEWLTEGKRIAPVPFGGEDEAVVSLYAEQDPVTDGPRLAAIVICVVVPMIECYSKLFKRSIRRRIRDLKKLDLATVDEADLEKEIRELLNIGYVSRLLYINHPKGE